MREITLMLIICFIASFSVNAQSNSADNNASQNQSADAAEIKRLNDELKKQYGAGKYDEALKLAEQELALCIKLYGAEGKEVAISYANIGSIYRAKYQPKEAIKALEQSLSILEKNNLGESAQAAFNMSDIGLSYSLSDDKIAAEEWLIKAIETAEKADGKYSNTMYACLVYAARFYRGSIQFEKANDVFLRTIDVANNLYGRKSDTVFSLWFEYECFLSEAKLIVNKEKIDELKGKEITAQDTNIIRGDVLNGKATKLPAPSYPAIARSIKASGTVSVRVLVNEEGKVIRACALSGHPLLRSACVTAALNAKFTPTLVNGKPVKVSGTINYNFFQ